MFCQAINYYNGKYLSYTKDKKDKTPLYIKFIYSLIGRDYKKICDLLIKIKILDIDMAYLPAYLDTNKSGEKKGLCRHYQIILPKDEKYIKQHINLGLTEGPFSRVGINLG